MGKNNEDRRFPTIAILPHSPTAPRNTTQITDIIGPTTHLPTFTQIPWYFSKSLQTQSVSKNARQIPPHSAPRQARIHSLRRRARRSQLAGLRPLKLPLVL